VLTIEPATVFDHEELTPELCEQGLQLVAPILADATRVEGQISLEVRRFVAPLDGPEPGGGIQQAEVDGVLVLHGVTAGLKSPILQAVARLLSTLLGVDAIDQVRILDESKVEFHLAEGRLHHEGLSFVFPDLSEALLVTSRGSVGLDETLDLVVEIPLPLTLVHDGPITRRLSARPLGLNIRGTLDEPRIELPADRQPWWELADALLREDAGSGEPAPVDAILDAVGRWLQPPTTEGSEGERPLLEGLLNRWQQRREDLRGRPGGRPADRPLLRGLFPPRAP
jgi:hypothetical protein